MTELAVVTPQRLNPLTYVPRDFEELLKFAEIAARTDMVPKSFADKDGKIKVGNIIIACQMGSELGMSPAMSLQSFAIVNGRATLWGDSLIGLVRGSGKCEYVKEWMEGEQGRDEKNEIDVSLDTRICFCETKRKGEAEPVVRTFSVQDARTAGLWMKEGPWRTYPMRQMAMRARGFCLRDVYADVLRGVSLTEEVQDFDEPTNVTPATDAAPPATRADAVRAALELAQKRAAAPTAAEPAATVVIEGEVEAPMPDVSHMLAEQIGEEINREAFDAGITPEELKALIPIATEGKRPGRSNAHAIIRAVRKLGADKKAPEEAKPADAAPAAEIDFTKHQCPIHGTTVAVCEDDSCREKCATYIAMAGQPTLLDGVSA